MSGRSRSGQSLHADGRRPPSPVEPPPDANAPEPADADRIRTRLDSLWQFDKPPDFYGAPQSREESRRQGLECLTAEYLLYRKDTQKLIAFYLAVVDRRPNDLAALYYLGRTYLDNGQPGRVLTIIGAAHRRYPLLLDFQELILEALLALGRDEADFEWATEIRVFRLDLSVIESCYDYLKRKRRPRYGGELQDLFSSLGCCIFSGAELVEALAGDSRFVVRNGGVRLRRRRRDKRAPQTQSGRARRKEGKS